MNLMIYVYSYKYTNCFTEPCGIDHRCMHTVKVGIRLLLKILERFARARRRVNIDSSPTSTTRQWATSGRAQILRSILKDTLTRRASRSAMSIVLLASKDTQDPPVARTMLHHPSPSAGQFTPVAPSDSVPVSDPFFSTLRTAKGLKQLIMP